MQKRRLVKNAAILTGSSLLLRTVGMVFRVWLSGCIGAEGMGLYSLILSVYLLAATFATGGIATAVTRLVAEELERGTPRSVCRIVRRAVALTLAVGAVSAAAVVASAEPVATLWIKDARAGMSLRLMAAALPFMGVSSCLKGYFIARRKALAPSNAQLLEQAVRMALTFAVVGVMAPKGLAFACAAVLLGDAVGEVASCAFLGVAYALDRRKVTARIGARSVPPYAVTKKLISLSLPLVGGRYLTTGLRTAESLMVPACLTTFAGSRDWAVSQFGLFRGMAMPVLFFLSSFLMAVSTLLVPELSTALASNDRRQVQSAVSRCIRLTLASAAPIAGVFFCFGGDVGMAVYRSDEVGFYVRWLAPLVPLMYLESVVTGMLNGLDQQKWVFRFNVADSVVRLALIPLCVTRFGMVGFLGVTYVSNLLTSLLCLARLLRVANVRVEWVDWLVRPLACTAAALAVGVAASRFCGTLTPIARLGTESVACLAVYLPAMAVTGGLRDARRWFITYRQRKRA